MQPKWHILYSFVFAIILNQLFHLSLLASFIIFLSAIFIDLDHVLIYFLETKDINPYKFSEWTIKRDAHYKSLSKSERKKLKLPHFIFHGIEFVVVLVLLILVHNLFLWILFGVIFHLILDFIHLFYEGITHYSIKTSQIWLWQRNKNKKKM